MNKRVLVITRSNILRRTVLEGLNGMQLDVAFAPELEDIYTYAKKTVPDLIIFDIVNPVKEEFARLNGVRSHENLKHVPIIYIVGSPRILYRFQLLSGRDSYVMRYFERESLFGKIREALALERAPSVEEEVAVAQPLEEVELIEEMPKKVELIEEAEPRAPLSEYDAVSELGAAQFRPVIEEVPVSFLGEQEPGTTVEEEGFQGLFEEPEMEERLSEAELPWESEVKEVIEEPEEPWYQSLGRISPAEEEFETLTVGDLEVTGAPAEGYPEVAPVEVWEAGPDVVIAEGPESTPLEPGGLEVPEPLVSEAGPPEVAGVEEERVSLFPLESEWDRPEEVGEISATETSEADEAVVFPEVILSEIPSIEEAERELEAAISREEEGGREEEMVEDAVVIGEETLSGEDARLLEEVRGMVRAAIERDLNQIVDRVARRAWLSWQERKRN